ncbi:hypothetical protein JST97_33050 [bacterium]|nr:hypothetical protein [bacterium]
MRCQVKLFLCYPLALITALVLAMVAAALSQMPVLAVVLSIFTCLPFYALLGSGLLGCSKLGGWPGFFYGLALVSLFLHLASLALAVFEHRPDLQDAALTIIALTMLGIYVSCSLAGFSIAWGSGRKVQAAMQILWPVLFFLGPLLTPTFTLFPILAYGLQGLQAMLLALSLHIPNEDNISQAAQTTDIGWESPPRTRGY